MNPVLALVPRTWWTILSIMLAALSAPVATSAPLLTPGDPIIAVGFQSESNSPINGNENAPKVVDQNNATKYLNFGEENSGFIVTPASGASVLQSFRLTTANDFDARDPATFALYGTNDPVISADHSFGLSEGWTLIASGALNLPNDRETVGAPIDVTNATSYLSYRMVFPTVRDEGNANSMQVAEAEFFTGLGATGTSILAPGDTVLAIDEDPGFASSSYPPAADPPETPASAIDGTLAKYLNFGEEGSGFIVTPSVGSSIVQSFTITTANDWESRDPSSFALFGTNDPITSTENSNGNAENWTLIASGGVTLPIARDTVGPTVAVTNSTPYTSYRMIFPTVRDPNGEMADSMQIAEIQFDGIIGTSDKLRITQFSYAGTTDELTLRWESQAGKVYDLLSSTDPEADGDPETWSPVTGQEGLAATPPLNTRTFTRPGDPTRLYVVLERDAPPVFSDDFETVQAWTTGANLPDTGTTVWQRGTPNSVASNGTPPISGANGSPNCWGTNISADYGLSTDIYLRSPAINLNIEGITEATLTMMYYLDTDLEADYGFIRVLDANTLLPLGSDIRMNLEGFPDNNTDWRELSEPLPSEALGQTILLEFQFTADAVVASNYAGWYIDDVAVSVK